LNFLNQSPCLKYIKIQLFFGNPYREPIFLSPIPHHNTLTHLNLRLSNAVCMKTIIYLFKCVPRLYHLKLHVISTWNLQLIEPTFWETAFSTYLIELKRLSLNVFMFNTYYSTDPVWNLLPDEKEVIKQIKKSNYWSSHQWKITFRSGLSTFQICWAK